MIMVDPAVDNPMANSEALVDEDAFRYAAEVMLQAQDNLIDSLPIPIRTGVYADDFEAADAGVVNLVEFNSALVNAIRLQTCRLLIRAGLPEHAQEEFESLSGLSFAGLDSFYRSLSISIGARACHDWFKSSESIEKFLSGSDKQHLARNSMIFAATCIECALVDKDYELAETIADTFDSTPPFEHQFLEWICIAYWFRPHRMPDAARWSEIAIANGCRSQYPFIIKCRSLLEVGDLHEAIACLDQGERFFYSIGSQTAYAAILKERSLLMDNFTSL